MDTSVLDPRGPHAEQITDLWWIMLVVSVVIFVLVMALLVIALVRSTRNRGENSADPPGGRFFVPVAGIALPALVLIGLFALALRTMNALESPAEAGAVTVEIVGHQWWWEVRYPDEDVVTANEIHIPVGEPVQVRLTAEGVIHSFWVPELAGKMDLIPGDSNELWFEADQPGVYAGECAEFCGVAHATMGFRVVAAPPEDFRAWLDHMRQPAPEPSTDLITRGQQVFLSSACVQCHTVRGTQATGDLGPDLTHVSSRRTLAAGTLDNTLANLTAWIVDPRALKPGTLMPPTNLSSEELQALVAYLQSLE